MNPHYIVLVGWIWSLLGKPVYFWRNHAKMNWMTKVAARFARRVFYTSPYACTRVFPHAVQMPVGIDTTLFTPELVPPHAHKKILFLGRLSPVKRPELFIAAAALLPLGYEVHIYGDDPTPSQEYGDTLKKQAGRNTFFHPSVKNYETPAIYHAHDLYVNLTPRGSMDKTVLEAVACGIPTLVVNDSFADTVAPSSIARGETPEELAQSIVALTLLSPSVQKAQTTTAREHVVNTHSLERLAKVLYTYITS